MKVEMIYIALFWVLAVYTVSHVYPIVKINRHLYECQEKLQPFPELMVKQMNRMQNRTFILTIILMLLASMICK